MQNLYYSKTLIVLEIYGLKCGLQAWQGWAEQDSARMANFRNFTPTHSEKITQRVINE